MVLIEVSPPFQWWPCLEFLFSGWRVMWGWVAIMYVPYDLDEFLEALAAAAVELEHGSD